ncbi:MAG TPA: AsmA-like C-terminal region-containing protein, partial [Chitinophaga sp.]
MILSQGFLEHAGGTISLKGRTFNKGNTDPFTLDAQLNKVKVDQFMEALNNFGLEDFSYKNVKGSFSAKAHLAGLLRDDGELVTGALNGSLSFNLANGALVDVPMFNRIAKFFPRRNLSNITFDDLQNTFTIRNGLVTIPPMHIATSAVVMDVKGLYGLGKVQGTNLQLDVPIRNPKKDRDIADDAARRKRSRRGIVLHFNAVNGPDGKVKLKLGKSEDADDIPEDEEN